MKKLNILFYTFWFLVFSIFSYTQTIKLDVEGGIKVGHTTTELEGTIRWNGNDLEVFDGTQWLSLTKTSSLWGQTSITPYSATEDLKVIASDAANGDNFGNRVAIQGDVAVIGATEDDDKGSVYVFERAGGVWSESAKLTASDGGSGHQFGSGVAIDGDVIVIGAQKDGNGSAYVFVKPGGGWATGTETAKLTASDGASGDRFGCSVDIAGDVIVVGAYFDHLTTDDQGSAYVFVKPGGGWATGTETAKLSASDANAFDYFGFEVAISGDVIVAGKFRDDLGGGPNDDKGGAYVFVKPGGGWASGNETAKLTASDAAIGDYFGYQVDIWGDVIVSGAYQDDLTSADEGSVYVFVKPGGGWTTGTETAKLTASDAANGDNFGLGLAIYDDIIVVGAYEDDLTSTDEGSAYVFEKPVGGWTNMTQSAKLTASDAAFEDKFGLQVEIFGNWIVVGSYLADLTSSDEGAAYFFER